MVGPRQFQGRLATPESRTMRIESLGWGKRKAEIELNHIMWPTILSIMLMDETPIKALDTKVLVSFLAGDRQRCAGSDVS